MKITPIIANYFFGVKPDEVFGSSPVQQTEEGSPVYSRHPMPQAITYSLKNTGDKNIKISYSGVTIDEPYKAPVQDEE